MKQIIAILFFSLFILAGCTSSDLPPEPSAPGATGNYYKYIGEWATESSSFSVSPDVITCDPNSNVEVSFDVTGEDYVYSKIFVWANGEGNWDSAEFSGELVPNSPWIRGDASLRISENCEELLELTDENNELFVVAYACTKVDGAWDCNDNKWQLQVISAQEKQEELPELPNLPGSFAGLTYNLGLNQTITITVGNNNYELLMLPGDLNSVNLYVNGEEITIIGDKGRYEFAGLNFFVDELFITDVPFYSAEMIINIIGEVGSTEEELNLALEVVGNELEIAYNSQVRSAYELSLFEIDNNEIVYNRDLAVNTNRIEDDQYFIINDNGNSVVLQVLQIKLENSEYYAVIENIADGDEIVIGENNDDLKSYLGEYSITDNAIVLENTLKPYLLFDDGQIVVNFYDSSINVSAYDSYFYVNLKNNYGDLELNVMTLQDSNLQTTTDEFDNTLYYNNKVIVSSNDDKDIIVLRNYKVESQEFTFCSDSDLGINPFKKGTLIDLFDGSIIIEDYCRDNNTLVEWDCQVKTNAGGEDVYCEKGCSEGACVAENDEFNSSNSFFISNETVTLNINSQKYNFSLSRINPIENSMVLSVVSNGVFDFEKINRTETVYEINGLDIYVQDYFISDVPVRSGSLLFEVLNAELNQSSNNVVTALNGTVSIDGDVKQINEKIGIN